MTAGSDRARRVRGLRAVQALGVVVLIVGMVLLAVTFAHGHDTSPAGAAAPTSATSAPSSASASPTTTAAPAEAPTERGGAKSVPAPAGSAAPVAKSQQPVRIAIPAIGVDSTLTELGIAGNGTIEVPSVPAQAGWLTSSPAPGQRGPAVIAGHVDSHTGPAVFYRLSSLKPGDAIVITKRNGSKVHFTVDGLAAYPKKHFPTQATYGPVPGPALRLITCGGSYVKSQGGYLDNVVVFAT